MVLWSIFVFIVFTAIFFFVIAYNTNLTRCNPDDNKCYDGNGRYQYKGRGYKKESVDVLLSRIDWLAKNSMNGSLYTISYIMALPITLTVIVILYACSRYIIKVWELIIILFSAFIVIFSILNLFSFHTDKYPNYYIRKNIEYISEKLDERIKEPPKPNIHSRMPFRTEVQDVISK